MKPRRMLLLPTLAWSCGGDGSRAGDAGSADYNDGPSDLGSWEDSMPPSGDGGPPDWSRPSPGGCHGEPNGDCGVLLLACKAVACDGSPIEPPYPDCIDGEASIAAASDYCWQRCTPDGTTATPDLDVPPDPLEPGERDSCYGTEVYFCIDGVTTAPDLIFGPLPCAACPDIAGHAIAPYSACM